MPRVCATLSLPAAAAEVLDTYFDRDNQAVQALRKRVDELAGQSVVAGVPPLDDALKTLQAYLKRREAAELLPEAAEEDGQ